MANIYLDSAKRNKKDEFHTMLKDIEKELLHYKDAYKNKTIFLNCNDTKESNFFKFFVAKFDIFSLKKLVSLSYTRDKEEAIKYEYDGKNIKETLIKSNGDFRSKESIKILEESDIVITNPPFSLFREYIEFLVSKNVEFLVIGPTNSLTYKNVFKLIKEGKVWLGYNSGSSYFYVPEEYIENNKIKRDENGKAISIGPGILWITNIENRKDKLNGGGDHLYRGVFWGEISEIRKLWCN